VGSYKWVAKEENLRKFVAVADPVFSQHGITLHIIGAMTEDMAAHVRATTQSTVVHGFVDDLAVHLRQARIAAVPEEIGGGFKLKFLDYIFGRVPVATLDHAAAGLPSDVRASLLRSDDLEGLVAQIVDNIQNDRLLHQLHEGALAAASQRYRWADRGITFVNAVLALKAA
jgi:glycosyltransferase involved in cell wall biosynthesis